MASHEWDATDEELGTSEDEDEGGAGLLGGGGPAGTLDDEEAEELDEHGENLGRGPDEDTSL